jgi:hypothetical protein
MFITGRAGTQGCICLLPGGEVSSTFEYDPDGVDEEVVGDIVDIEEIEGDVVVDVIEGDVVGTLGSISLSSRRGTDDFSFSLNRR